MVFFLLVAGIGLLLAGLAAIGFGIPVKEFSFGNTLIFTGTVAACTGLVMLGLGMVVRELKTIAGRIALRPPVPGRAAAKAPGDLSAKQAAENDGLMFGLDQPGLEKPREADPVTPPAGPAPAPWLEEATARDRGRQDTPPAPLPEPAAKPRRNLLFSTSSRKERERAEARAADPSAAELDAGPPIAPPLRPAETPPASIRTTPGRNRNARGSPMRYRSGAATAHHRRLPKPAPAHPRWSRIRRPCRTRACRR